MARIIMLVVIPIPGLVKHRRIRSDMTALTRKISTAFLARLLNWARVLDIFIILRYWVLKDRLRDYLLKTWMIFTFCSLPVKRFNFFS